ncbi:HAD-IIB family hydrolase [Dubosiella newyorkensis]|uniref:HAD-IIB family hydrolase n=1 Tax=Dubosiella newyorkensis TaxID=1862672 RepID=UPI0032B2ECB2
MNDMIGSDFDGTLLKNGYISPTTRNHIKAFRKNGNYFVIVTGRSVPKMIEGIHKYDIDFFDFIICSNGAVLLDRNLQVVEETHFTVDEIKKIIEFYKDRNLVFSTVKKLYSLNQLTLATESVSAVSFESKNRVYSRDDTIHLVQNGKYVDIVPKGTSKSSALLKLSEKMHINNLFTIGDSENDLDLLSCSPQSYSFHHCPNEVKSHATQCFETIEEVLDTICRSNLINPIKVSVIIPTYNRQDLLEMTLQSLLQQTFDSDLYEIIICDDGSTDDTFPMIKKYINQLNIQYIYHKNNGFRAAYTRNCGIKAANGDLLIFIDSGMIVHNDFVFEHFKIHNTSLKEIVGSGRVLGFEKGKEIEQKIIKMYIPHNIKIYLSPCFEDRRMQTINKTHIQMENWPAPWVDFWSCNFSIKKSLMERIGMFDESFIGWGGEDTDLAIRLFIKNIPFIFIDTAIALHYPHPHSELSGPLLEQRKIIRKTNLINKYQLPEMKYWLQVGSSKLNQFLLGRKL